MSTEIAGEILALTRVQSNVGSLQPGQAVTVDVIPSMPVVAPGLTTAAGLLPLRVRYEVRKAPFTDADIVTVGRIPETPSDIAEFGDLLSVAFLLPPSIDFGGTGQASSVAYQIRVTISVASTSRTVTIPVTVPALRVPAIALHGSAPDLLPWFENSASAYVLMTSPAAEVGSVQEVLKTYNELTRTLETLLGFLSIATSVTSAVLAPLRLLTKTLRSTPLPPGFVVGSALDFDAYAGSDRVAGGGFDNENRSLLLLAPTNLAIELFENPPGIDDPDYYVRVEPLSLRDIVLEPNPSEKIAFVRKALGVPDNLTSVLDKDVPMLSAAVGTLLDTLGMGVTYIPDLGIKGLDTAHHVSDSEWKKTGLHDDLRPWFLMADDEAMADEADGARWRAL